jgi:hypothetical protein
MFKKWFDNEVFLDKLESKCSYRRDGQIFLKTVCDIADAVCVDFSCQAQPVDRSCFPENTSSGPDLKKLVIIYKGYGFVELSRSSDESRRSCIMRRTCLSKRIKLQ